jgi:hypothetical protein
MTSRRDRERNQTMTDTREQMLAEMARAFNVGLGLSPPPALPFNAASSSAADPLSMNSTMNSASAGMGATRRGTTVRVGVAGGGGGQENGEARDGRDLPPEGSFERFLVELQSDLRVALTQEGVVGESFGGEEREERGDDEADNETEEEEAPSVRSLVVPSGPVVPPAESSEAREEVESVLVTAADEEEEEDEEEDEDMPTLQDVNNSSGDEDEEGDEEEDEDDSDMPSLQNVSNSSEGEDEELSDIDDGSFILFSLSVRDAEPHVFFQQTFRRWLRRL